MDAASKDSRLQFGRDGGVLMQRMVRRPSPRQRVANHLLDMGYKLNDDDIKHTHGGKYKRLDDIIECWTLHCADQNDKEVQITSAHTLTECAAGIEIEASTADSDLYGDLIAIPKRRTPNKDSAT